MESDVLTLAEVADLVRAPVGTVRYWRYLGTGPRGFKAGRRVLFLRDDVDNWLAERREADLGRVAAA